MSGHCDFYIPEGCGHDRTPRARCLVDVQRKFGTAGKCAFLGRGRYRVSSDIKGVTQERRVKERFGSLTLYEEGNVGDADSE
jgi:hypothetical protein